MNFQIKLYRAPDTTQRIIMVGQTSAELLRVEQILPAADRTLYRLLKEHLESDSSEPPRLGPLQAVRKAIAESLKDGKPKLIQVAKKLELGPRSLQRRLKSHGMDFKEIVTETRCRLALTYLNDTKTTVTEIALSLGYSEVSAFNRAFKRWTGSSPLTYRRVIGRSRRQKS
jgi:AraC-like DNA-binding protein